MLRFSDITKNRLYKGLSSSFQAPLRNIGQIVVRKFKSVPKVIFRETLENIGKFEDRQKIIFPISAVLFLDQFRIIGPLPANFIKNFVQYSSIFNILENNRSTISQDIWKPELTELQKKFLDRLY